MLLLQRDTRENFAKPRSILWNEGGWTTVVWQRLLDLTSYWVDYSERPQGGQSSFFDYYVLHGGRELVVYESGRPL